MSLQIPQEKQKKSKSPKIPKDLKICQSVFTKSSSKGFTQLINKSPKILSTKSVKTQKMETEIYLDMNSTKRLERTSTISREEFTMH